MWLRAPRAVGARGRVGRQSDFAPAGCGAPERLAHVGRGEVGGEDESEAGGRLVVVDPERVGRARVEPSTPARTSVSLRRLSVGTIDAGAATFTFWARASSRSP